MKLMACKMFIANCTILKIYTKFYQSNLERKFERMFV